MPKDLFCKNVFTIQCILGNKIIATRLANTCATIYGFFYKQFAKKIYQVHETKTQHLIKSKQI